jgi:hypothetical protein
LETVMCHEQTTLHHLWYLGPGIRGTHLKSSMRMKKMQESSK